MKGCKHCRVPKNKNYQGHFWRYKRGHPCGNCGRSWHEIDKEIYEYDLIHKK